MPNLLPHQREMLIREGSFIGLQTLSQQGVPPAVIKAIASGVFKALKVELAEARKELTHLQNAITSMDAACQAGLLHPSGTGKDGNIDRFVQTFITFDAWAVSLMETSLTIAGLLNPTHTRKKIVEFSNAMNALMDKRAAMQHPVIDDPSLFKGYVDR